MDPSCTDSSTHRFEESLYSPVWTVCRTLPSSKDTREVRVGKVVRRPVLKINDYIEPTTVPCVDKPSDT